MTQIFLNLLALSLTPVFPFLILFALALLFVIGSAGAMRYLDNKRVTRKDNEDDKEGE